MALPRTPTEDLPDPTQAAGAPHPRDTPRQIGQATAEDAFLASWNAGRLHSGWLLIGPPGVGKATLAYRIATFLLATPVGAVPARTLDIPTENPDAHLVRAGAHPRLHVVRRGPNATGDRLATEITADRVRKLKSFFHLSAADGGARVVIVDPADEMNPTAANALLKELEEPPANTTLLLISHRPAALLPTIRSRCRTLRLAPLAARDLDAALTQAGIATDAPEALSVLAQGSVGDAIRMMRADGAAIYAAWIEAMATLPALDRARVLKLAEACAGRGAEARFELTLDLVDLFLSRAARAGLMGEPTTQGASGEARLLARISPDDVAARAWAALQARVSARARHGRAVNLDPAALILDIALGIEDTARAILPATPVRGARP